MDREHCGRWRFAVDRGGTFTDIVGIAPGGALHTGKLLSVSDTYEDAGVEGIRRMLNIAPGERLDASVIDVLRIGTTVATNALLERKGEPTALCTTAGFEDLLAIGNGARPELFNLKVEKPPPLYSLVEGVRETVDARGRVIAPLDIGGAEKTLERIRKSGFDNLAIVLKHSWKNPAHEQLLGRIALEKAGFRHVILSHEVMPLLNFLKRGQTTMIEAYLGPVLFAYAQTLKRLVGEVAIEFMQSSGGLVDANLLKAKDTILSGPAGGVIGFSSIAKRLEIPQSIGFDMGGTSTDVSRYDGAYNHVFESSIDGVPFHTDMLDVETVASGGGSILTFDGERLRTGPESAGSDPGPACYGLGGPLTVTDANMLLGRIVPEFMPRTFGKTRDRMPDIEAARKLFTALTERIERETGISYSPPELAAGFLRVANETMCRAMKKISVARGYDIRRHALVSFGGAASQHACDIANLLDIGTVVVPLHSSVLSAYGIAVADRTERTVRAVMRPLTADLPRTLLGAAKTSALPVIHTLRSASGTEPLTTVSLDMRPRGADTWLPIPCASGTGDTIVFKSAGEIRRAFEREYLARFGFRPDDPAPEVVNMRTETRIATSLAPDEFDRDTPTRQVRKSEAVFSRPVWIDSGFEQVPVFDRTRLSPGDCIDGPAMIADDQLTLLVQKGFAARVDGREAVVLENKNGPTEAGAHEAEAFAGPDPVMLEVCNNLFMNVAEQMGHTLSNTAHSVNMKERHDFSCALFDGKGNLVSNAPHIPVHLGAMEATVRHIIDENRSGMREGDMYLANDPHRGGSHLPDMTIVTPFFSDGGPPAFFLANRGHHADIGGIRPGSMPPSSRSIEDEGVVIGNFLLVRGGRLREREVRRLLSSGPYPARNIEERLSDLKAQVAANNRGVTELQRIMARYGRDVVERYMRYIQDNARRAMQRALGNIAGESGFFHSGFEDRMDNGAKIAVSITVRTEQGKKPRALIDFTGTSPEDPGNINAPQAVTRAAVLYVLRGLIEEDIPLNAGCLEPVEILVPGGSLLNPSNRAAVAVGNVETSQRIVDVLLGALGKAAASQGTMNNLLFGRPDDSGGQYYETIPGGSGALEGHCGASGVQVHMTNTRITDPEVLEERFPEVAVTGFSLRRCSGGAGRWRGGDGVRRALLFNTPMQVTVISERRKASPFGLDGGKPGMRGVNRLIAEDGREIRLEGRVDRIVEPGETIVIETPGGGGYGKE